MSTSLNLKYNLTFNASTKLIDIAGEFSSEDVIQQQVLFNSNSLVNAAAKGIEIPLYPTPYLTPSNNRIYDIDLDALNVGYIRIVYIKAEAQFLYSTSNSLLGLNSAPRTLAQAYVLDKGNMPSPSIFTPDEIYPKFIRLINPLEVNGGGSGNSLNDIPLLVSCFIVTTPSTPSIP